MADLKHEAEGAPYCLTTSMMECPFNRFWVVLLDCGLEVYQSFHSHDMDNPWLRLKQFCQDHHVTIANMAFVDQSLDGQVNLDPGADGYFYSKRCRKLLAANPNFTGMQDDAEGVGELKGDILTIHWKLDDGRNEIEVRDLSKVHHKHREPLSLIRK